MALQPPVPRTIRLAHPARAERRLDLIRPEFAPCCQRHFFFNSAVQFTTRWSGAADSSVITESTTNRLPSRVTSYWFTPAAVRNIVENISNKGRVEATCNEPPVSFKSTAINFLSEAR